MDKTIKFDTSDTSLQKTLLRLLGLEKEFRKIKSTVIETMVDEGEKIVKETISSMDAVNRGELLSGVETETSEDKGSVFIDIDKVYHAEFVEYGTGVIGERSPHPNLPPGWIYDTGGYGDKGWVYYDEQSGEFRRTAGMPSRPFMYQSSETLRERSKDIMKKVVDEL